MVGITEAATRPEVDGTYELVVEELGKAVNIPIALLELKIDCEDSL